jgi:hypothetical protein
MANLPKPLIGLLLGTVAFFAVWMVALKPSSSSSSGGSPSGVGQYQPAINQAHQAVTTSNAANAKLGAPTATTAGPAAAAPKAAVAPNAKAAAPKAKAAAPSAKAAAPKVKAPASAHAHPLALKAALQRAFSRAAWDSWLKQQRAEIAAQQKADARLMADAIKADVPYVPVEATPAEQVKALQTAVAGHDVVAILFYNPAAADDRAMTAELAAVPVQHGVFKLAVPVSELTQFAAITAQIPVVTAPTLILIDPARHATAITGFASQLEINQRIADAAASN